jgi:hypothetical protein
MAVSVRIEDEAFSDRRYDLLARELGLPDADCARGKMAAVWRQCTQQQTHILSVAMVCAVLGENGPRALENSSLGVVTDTGIRICGTKGRIEWLAKLRKNARKGGAATSAKRHSNRRSSGSSAAVPIVSPPAPAPAPAPAKEESGSPDGLAPLFDKVDRAAGEVGRQRNTKAAKRRAAENPDHQAAIDGFHQRYKAAYGTKPDWNGKTIGMLSALGKRHPLPVLLERMDFMFSGKAPWPPPPYSMDVFVQHFDRWVDISPRLSAPIRKEQEL